MAIIKKIDNFFSENKMEDAKIITNLILDLKETKKIIKDCKFTDN